MAPRMSRTSRNLAFALRRNRRWREQRVSADAVNVLCVHGGANGQLSALTNGFTEGFVFTVGYGLGLSAVNSAVDVIGRGIDGENFERLTAGIYKVVASSGCDDDHVARVN